MRKVLYGSFYGNMVCLFKLLNPIPILERKSIE